MQLLQAVKNGTIQDVDRVRGILQSAQQTFERKRKRFWVQEQLLADATEAFINGWKGAERTT